MTEISEQVLVVEALRKAAAGLVDEVAWGIGDLGNPERVVVDLLLGAAEGARRTSSVGATAWRYRCWQRPCSD